jgi:3-hydroxy-5-methyl-1-naphthoate 3-O-methyltransferase
MKVPTLEKFPRQVLAGIDIQRAFIVSRLIVAAERLQIFRALHGRRMKAEEIGRLLKIHSFHCGTFLNILVSLGLLHKRGDVYRNTRFAEKYFIEERSIYWTRQYSKECVKAYEALTVLEKALASGRSCKSLKSPDAPSYTDAMLRDRGQAEDFTQMLFHFHQEDAQALAKYLDLSKRQAVLDVGGGSGVMSIALAKRNPQLRACVLDLPTVCEVAARNIRGAGLSRRMSTLAGDIRHKLPSGYDVIMFCDIGPLPPNLVRNCHNSLPGGGLIVAVDRYLSDDRSKPMDRLAASFVGSSFGLATKSDVVEALRCNGFQSVKARQIYGDVWCITGIKPKGGTKADQRKRRRE